MRIHFVAVITMAACTTPPAAEPRSSERATTDEVATNRRDAPEGTRVDPAPPIPPPRPPCAEGTEPGAPLLSLETDGTHGMDFSERTLVTCDGRVTVRALIPFSSSEAGEYTLRLDPDELARARAIAHDMIGAPAAPMALPPQGADTMAVAHSDPTVSGRADTSAAHGAAFAWLGEVTSRAQQHPEHTVTLSVLGHQERTLVIRIENRGRRDSSFTLDAQGSRVSWSGGSAGITMILPVEQHLSDASSNSATLQPGGHVVLGLTLDAAPPADATAALTLAGHVHGDAGFPEELRLSASEPRR